MHIYIYIYIYIYIFIFINYIYIHTHIHTHTHTHTHTYYIYTYIYHIYIHMHIYIYIYMYVCIYAHTHTHTGWSVLNTETERDHRAFLQAVKDPRDPYNFLGVLGGVEEKMLGDSRLGQGSGQGLFLLIVFWGCRRRGDRETERCSDAVSLFHSLFEIVLCFCVFFFTDALDAVMLRAKREKLDSSTNAQKYSLYSHFSIVNIPGH